MNNLRVVNSVFIILTVLQIVFISNSYADSQPNIETEQFWIVLPPDVARNAAGYGIIKNRGSASDTLLGIRSNAGAVMLHKTDIESGMARMIHMPNIVIEPKTELVLEPMSFHLMFSELTPVIFTEGGKAILLFEFEKSGVIEIEVPIRSAW